MQETFVKTERLRFAAHPSFNDTWLHEQIVNDPSVLGLGTGFHHAQDARQRDGRLELVLRDDTGGGSPPVSVAVVVVARAADESDLLRTIENWAVERGQHPDDEQFAVLVAESFPPRVLSAASALTAAIPLSALQLSALRVDEQVVLNVTPVIDRMPKVETSREDGETASGNPNGEGNGHAAALPAPASENPPTTAISLASAWRDEEAVFSSSAIGNMLNSLSSISSESFLAELEAGANDEGDTPSNAPATSIQSPDKPQPRTRQNRAFSLLCLVSLLLCAAAAIGWGRSFVVRDVYSFADRSGREHAIYSDRGQLDWIASASRGGFTGEGNDRRYVTIPHWLPAGLFAIPPAAWLIRRRTRKA